MSSQRRIVRTAVADGLRARALAGGAGALALAGVGDRVYANRTRPIPRAKLPAIRVYTDREQVDYQSGPTRYVRTADLVIEIVHEELAAVANEHDALDEIGHDVETWMFDRECLEDVWMSAILTSVETGRVSEAETSMAAHRITFAVQYEDFAPRTQPEDVDFESLAATYVLQPSVDDEVDAEDLVAIPQD